MGDFTKLKIWQKAHELTIRVYTLTRKLPKEEDYVSKPQARRAAVSVESCIAEGETRFTVAAQTNFFIDSRSSAAEVQTQLLIIRDVYNDFAQEAENLIREYEALAKQINNLISYRRSVDHPKKTNHPKTQSPNNLKKDPRTQQPKNLIT